MRKHRRHDWRNLPPKKMIRSMSALRLAMKQWGVNTVEMDKIGEEVSKSLMRGIWDELFGYSVAKRGTCYEHTYTAKQGDEPHWGTVEGKFDEQIYRYAGTIPPAPTLSMDIESIPVSYALYNQLIAREPESYMSTASLV